MGRGPARRKDLVVKVQVRQRREKDKVRWQADIHGLIPKGGDAPERFRLVAPPSVTSRSGAERWAMEQARKIAADGRPHNSRKAREEREQRDKAERAKHVPKLAEWSKDYLELCEAERRKPATMATKRDLLRVHLLPQLGDKTLTECCSEIEIARLKVAIKGLGVSRANSVLGLLAHMLSWAAKRYTLDLPEIKKRKRPRVDTVKAFADDALARIVAAAKARPRWNVLVLLMLDAGMRTGEVIALTWDAIDFDKGTIDVRANMSRGGIIDTPKSGHARKLPISSRLRQALVDLPRRGNHVLPAVRSAGDKPSHHRSIGAGWRAVMKRAGVPMLSPHSGRHSFATSLLRAGVDLKKVQKLMDHADLKTTAIYLHALDSDADAIDMLEAHHGRVAETGTRPSLTLVRSATGDEKT